MVIPGPPGVVGSSVVTLIWAFLWKMRWYCPVSVHHIEKKKKKKRRPSILIADLVWGLTLKCFWGPFCQTGLRSAVVPTQRFEQCPGIHLHAPITTTTMSSRKPHKPLPSWRHLKMADLPAPLLWRYLHDESQQLQRWLWLGLSRSSQLVGTPYKSWRFPQHWWE